MTKLVIELADNGWILKALYKKDPDENRCYAFSHEETSASQAKTFAELLWLIKELIGPSESRYSKERVMINIEPGDKYIDEKENGRQ